LTHPPLGVLPLQLLLNQELNRATRVPGVLHPVQPAWQEADLPGGGGGGKVLYEGIEVPCQGLRLICSVAKVIWDRVGSILEVTAMLMIMGQGWEVLPQKYNLHERVGRTLRKFW
jgi:hypothetical protein